MKNNLYAALKCLTAANLCFAHSVFGLTLPVSARLVYTRRTALARRQLSYKNLYKFLQKIFKKTLLF